MRNAAAATGSREPTADAHAGPSTPAEARDASAPGIVSATNGHKHASWTRERIIDELAAWMSKGAIDAPFMSRHGPRGLVAAIYRVFGRFEVAMNAAALHVSKQDPDGTAARDVRRAGRPKTSA